MTDLEKIVYEAIKEDCKYDYCSDIKMVSERTKLKNNVIKGVVGSLTKKGYVECDYEDHNGRMYHDIFAIVDDELWSYAVDCGMC